MTPTLTGGDCVVVVTVDWPQPPSIRGTHGWVASGRARRSTVAGVAPHLDPRSTSGAAAPSHASGAMRSTSALAADLGAAVVALTRLRAWGAGHLHLTNLACLERGGHQCWVASEACSGAHARHLLAWQMGRSAAWVEQTGRWSRAGEKARPACPFSSTANAARGCSRGAPALVDERRLGGVAQTDPVWMIRPCRGSDCLRPWLNWTTPFRRRGSTPQTGR